MQSQTFWKNKPHRDIKFCSNLEINSNFWDKAVDLSSLQFINLTAAAIPDMIPVISCIFNIMLNPD